MTCLRCGRKTDENQIFCQECLEVMEKQPVKPDTPIQIPNRFGRTVQKRTNAKNITKKGEKKLFRLRSAIFWLVLLAIVLAAALALCICVMLQLTPEWVNDLLLGDSAYQLIVKQP